MTSSNADFAKYILSKIFVDEKTGQPEDYWKYFDLCLADARKPYFFTMDSEFYNLKQDYADTPTSRLATDRWFSQGNHKTLVEFFKSHLKWPQHKELEVCYFGDSSKSDVLSARKVNLASIACFTPIRLQAGILCISSKSLIWKQKISSMKLMKKSYQMVHGKVFHWKKRHSIKKHSKMLLSWLRWLSRSLRCPLITNSRKKSSFLEFETSSLYFYLIISSKIFE